MRKLLFGLFGFVALGVGALGFGIATAQPAEAQPYYPGYRHRYGPPPGYYVRPGYRPYRPYYGYRPGYRPYRPAYAAPYCFTRNRQVWNGYRWVWRPVRVCR